MPATLFIYFSLYVVFYKMDSSIVLYQHSGLSLRLYLTKNLSDLMWSFNFNLLVCSPSQYRIEFAEFDQLIFRYFDIRGICVQDSFIFPLLYTGLLHYLVQSDIPFFYDIEFLSVTFYSPEHIYASLSLCILGQAFLLYSAIHLESGLLTAAVKTNQFASLASVHLRI